MTLGAGRLSAVVHVGQVHVGPTEPTELLIIVLV